MRPRWRTKRSFEGPFHRYLKIPLFKASHNTVVRICNRYVNHYHVHADLDRHGVNGLLGDIDLSRRLAARGLSGGSTLAGPPGTLADGLGAAASPGLPAASASSGLASVSGFESSPAFSGDEATAPCWAKLTGWNPRPAMPLIPARGSELVDSKAEMVNRRITGKESRNAPVLTRCSMTDGSFWLTLADVIARRAWLGKLRSRCYHSSVPVSTRSKVCIESINRFDGSRTSSLPVPGYPF